MNDRSFTGDTLEALLNPTTVAVIGGSNDPARIGGRPIRYMQAAGYTGTIYPVNPKHDRVQGLQSYPSIDAVPGSVDQAIVAVPASAVPATLESCAAKGVRTAVVFSAGFAEIGGNGAVLQDRITEIARSTGLRVLGPNCLGAYNPDSGFFGTFSSTLEDRFPESGTIGLVSQSGAYGSHLSLLAARRQLGIRYWVTTGNESDITVSEVVEWFAGRPEVSVIVAYAEGVGDSECLLRALSKARAARKPVIFMKVGTTAVGAEAARSHTASLAGADAVYDAAFRQFGAYRAQNTEEMLDVAYAASFGVLPASRRVALLTISGGVGVQMADAAVRHGLDVAPMSQSAQTALKRDLPFAAPRNPVDVTAQAFNDVGLISSNLELILQQKQYDSVIAFFTYVAASAAMVEPIRTALSLAKQHYPDRVLVLSMVGPSEILRAYEAVGCLVFEDPTRAVRAVAALATFRTSFEGPHTEWTPSTRVPRPLPDFPLNEHTASQILEAAHVPMIQAQLVSTADEAASVATALGFPVALKLCSPDITHKTEVNGIELGVSDTTAVRAGFDRLSRVASDRPGTRFDGALVSKMAEPGVEMVIGVHRDPTFGPVVMVGFGGLMAEVLNDVSFRIPPFDTDEAERMIRELRGFALLAGTRGQPPHDLDGLATALARFSEFAADHRDELESAEINPIRVFPNAGGVMGLDAVVIPRRQHTKKGRPGSPERPREH